MQARLVNEMKDPVMKGLIYGVAGYSAATFLYSLTNKEHVKAAPKKEAEHKAAPVAKDAHAPAAASAAASHSAAAPADHAHTAVADHSKQQVAPVLQQLSGISDRLTKIEKALGI